MLRLLRASTVFSSRNSLLFNSKTIHNVLVSTFASDKRRRPNREALIAERQKIQYNKKDANMRIVEQLFFPDETEKKIQEFLKEKRQQLAEQGQDTELGKLPLSQEDVKYIDQISSQGTNEEAVAAKSFYFPESREEMSKLIANTDINDKLLKFYMKHHRQSGKQQIFELLEKLKENLNKEGAVKDKEIEKYQKKVQKLKKVNKDIEIPFTAIFLTREQTLNHPGFQFLMKNINFKAEKKIYQPYTVLELYHNLLRFDAKTAGFIDINILKRFETELNQHNIYTIGKLINLLQHYKELKLPEEEARMMLEKIAQVLNKKDFSQITKKEILSIIVPLKKIGLPFNDEVMFRLEPYILKYISEIDPNKLSEIFLTYLTLKKGSVQFMQFLISSLVINLDKISLSYIKTIMTLANTDFSRRKDLSLEDLRRGAAKELMKSIGDWRFNNDEILQVLRSMVRDSMANENDYEMIAVEFMKRLLDLNADIFMEMYYDFAVTDLSSKTLAYGCNQKIINVFEDLQGRREQKIAGLIESSEEASSSDNVKTSLQSYNLNKYERNYANNFKLALKTVWAYSMFIVKHKEWTLINLDLWNLCVRELNNMIKKLKSFNGLIPFTRKDMELVHQINLFSTIHAKNSLNIDMKELKAANLRYKDQLYSHPLPLTVSLFWLERNYFMKKYRAAVNKYIESEHYVYEVVLENPSNSSKTNIFINDSSDFLGYYSQAEVRDKGYLKMRRHYLEKIEVPFVEIGYDEFLKNLSSVKALNEGYIEHALSRYVTLPTVADFTDKAESEKLSNIWEKIKELREEISETSLALEGLGGAQTSVEEFAYLQKRAGQNAVEELIENEEEDVYRDSDSEGENEEKPRE